MTQITLSVVAYTNRGLVRRANEDCVGIGSQILASDMREPAMVEIAELPTALLLADGLGGHGHGAIASQMSIAFLQSQVRDLAGSEQVRAALMTVHKNVLELHGNSDSDIPMGTTVVGALIRQHGFLTFNLGDSRAYMHSHGQLIQISHDDNLTSMAVKAQGMKHLVTQSIGGTWFLEEIDPHCAEHPFLRPDERLLLCSDGLTRMVDDAEIEDIFNSSCDVQIVMRGLIAAAFAAGAKDNVSIIIAKTA